MPRADFYLIGKPRFREQPLLLVCELARKAFESGQELLILADSYEQAEALDDLLWSFDDDAYLPHQIAGSDEDEELAPILIVPPHIDQALRPLVLNLRPQPVSGACARILEVVPADPAARDPLRARWRHYQSAGFELNKFDM